MIHRDPAGATAREHDIIVVGGGSYGVAAALEGARRGLRVLLIERDDFGGATSLNSLATIHGGLRYLQKLDFRRFRESTAERSWFLRNFPDQVAPLACLMPLYGDGGRRPVFFRAAVLLNGLLSRNRNAGIREDRRLPAGNVIDAAETARLFPGVRREGLRGGGVWHDGTMICAPRLLIEMLRWACSAGALALNYTEARRLIVDAGRATGVEATDRATGGTRVFRGAAVLNCAGPWCRSVAAAFDRDVPDLFRPSLAFNLLLERTPPSTHAVAVSAPEPESRVYFVIPRSGRVLAGTYYAPTPGGGECAEVPADDLRRFLHELNRGMPGFDVDRKHVLRVYAGRLPVKRDGTLDLATRPVFHDHGAAGGPRGLFSVSGVKYTTARLVAEEAIRRLLRGRGSLPPVRSTVARPEPFGAIDATTARALLGPAPSAVAPALRRMIAEESVLCREDLIDRRAEWGLTPDEADAADRRIAEIAPDLPRRVGP